MVHISFQDYLDQAGVDEAFQHVFYGIVRACEKIRQAILTADIGKAGTKNVYGEEQLALDVLSDKIIQKELFKVREVGLLASEELPKEMRVSDGPYAVAYDPLDGSSLVDVNLSVGSIFGIYKRSTFIGAKGSEQLASLFVVYGPRTTMMVTMGDGVKEFTLQQDDTSVASLHQNDDSQHVFQRGPYNWIMTRDNVQVSGNGKMFAPGNLRATVYRNDYVELMKFWMKEQYTLRYSGGMVPDINQILLKGKGIFTYPGYEKAPNGKLRLLFECAPLSFLMEQAGGASTDGKIRILEKELTELEQRTPIYIGAKKEVEIAARYLERENILGNI